MTAQTPGRMVGSEHIHLDGDRVALRVSTCRSCGSAWFPALPQCATCGSGDVVESLTSSTGTTYASTVVRIGPPRFPAPYPLAYVDIDGVRVLTHVQSADAPPPGTAVELVLAQIGADADGPLLSYAVRAAVPGREEDR